MPIECPRCQGTDFRAIAPGWVECLGSIDATIPPGLFGNPSHIGGARRCGHQFQVPAAGPHQPCGIGGCGRDSIGTCQGECGRRLCGLHAPTGGTFLCGECAAQRHAEEQRQRAAAQAARAAEAEARRAAVAARLESCTTAEALRAVLLEHSREVAVEDLRSVWCRFAASGALDPSDEIVTVRGEQTRAGRVLSGFVYWWRGVWSEVPGTRANLWRAPGAGRRGPRGGTRTEPCDVWLDAHGDAWWSYDRDVELNVFGREPRESRFLLPKGASFKAKRSTRTAGHTFFIHRVRNARSIEPMHADAEDYVRAVVTALAPGEV